MYIDGNFKVFQYLEDERIVGPIFECDELMAPIISLLNRAGLKTVYCCSGHACDHALKGKDDNNNDIVEIVPDIGAYIAFELDPAMKLLLKSFGLPNDFYYDENNYIYENIICIRYDYKNLNDMDTYFIEQLDMVKSLFLWAKDVHNKIKDETYDKVSKISASGSFDSMKEFKEFNVLN